MPPGVNTTDTDLSLLGRGYPNYGQKTAQNFLHLLENFASGTPPANAIQGELWYDNFNNKLKVNISRDSQRWSPANGVWQQPNDPSTSTSVTVSPGDLWVNTTEDNYILSVRTNVGSWVQVSTTSTGDTGSFATPLYDSNGTPHWVVEHKSLGTVIAIDTSDSFYPNPVIPNFNILNTGTNMASTGKFWGTAYSADALNYYPGASTLRIPTSRFLIKDDLKGGDIPGPGQIITGRLFFQNADGVVLTTSDDPYGASQGKIRIYKSNNDLVLNNDRQPDYGYGNIILHTRLGLGSVLINSSAPSVSTATGAVTIVGGVGIGGDLWVGGKVHGGGLVAGSANNMYGGTAGQLLYQITTGTTGFVTTSYPGNILVSSGTSAPYFQSSSTVQVGYATNSSNVMGGVAGQFVVQIAPNQTGFLDASAIQVETAINLAGPAGTYPYQIQDNLTEYLTPDHISVNTATNLAGGDVGQFAVQGGIGQTTLVDPHALAIGNVYGGTQGSILYQSYQDITDFLDIGSPGQYMKVSVNAPLVPSWQDPTGLALNQVAYGNGIGTELVGDNGMTYNPLTQTLTLLGDVIAGSDCNIKDNIETITDALDKVLSLRGVSFNYKKSGLPSIGLIAQEVKEVIPMIVSEDETTGIQGVKYGPIVGLLIEAIKEQQAQIEELKKLIG
jgi:hypothetical protein